MGKQVTFNNDAYLPTIQNYGLDVPPHPHSPAPHYPTSTVPSPKSPFPALDVCAYRGCSTSVRPSAKWSPPQDLFAQFERVARDVRHCHHDAAAAPANPISPTHPQSFSFRSPIPHLPSSFLINKGQAPFPLPPSFPPSLNPPL